MNELEGNNNRQQQDFDDLNNELADRGHKIRRFTGDDMAIDADSDERGSKNRAIDTLQILEHQRLADIQQRLAELDRVTAEELRLAQEHLDEMRAAANRTRDGELVFLSEDGNYYDEHGNEVDPAEIDPDTWDPNGPSFENWRAGQDRLDGAETNRDRFEQSRDRAASGDLTEDELADLESDFDALELDRGWNPDTTQTVEAAVTNGPFFQQGGP